MKKLTIVLALLTTLVLGGCSEEQQLNLNTTQVVLFSLDEHLITSDGTNVRFTSQNPYIAAVNETTGVVTARTIGETVIDVTADQGTASVRVVVKPKHNLYVEPCVDFTKTKSDILAMYGTPESETSTGVMYAHATDVSSIHIGDIYLFDSSNTLTSACALINESAALELVEFLCERYMPVDIDGSTYYLVNGLSEETITMMVMVTPMSGYTINQVIYAPYNNTTRSFVELDLVSDVSSSLLEPYRSR